MHVSLGRERIHPAVPRTSERTYQGYFGRWKLFHVSVGLPGFLLAGARVNSDVSLLVAYITCV